MKKNIAVVKKWLANPESVSQSKLKDNYNDVQEAWGGFYSTAQKETMGIVHSEYDVRVANAAYMAMNNDIYWTTYWVNQCEAITEKGNV